MNFAAANYPHMDNDATLSGGNATFAAKVYSMVAHIPAGRVMTYGQLAALAGHPRAARIVGTIAHYGPEELPWHRVVNKQGGLAGEFPGGRTEHARRLHNEGTPFKDEFIVDVTRALYELQ